MTVAILAGALYIASLYWREHLLSEVFAIPTVVTREYLRSGASTHQLGALLLRLPALGALACLLVACSQGSFRQALATEHRRVIYLSVALTCAISIVLNAADVWPFTWRALDAQSVAYASALKTDASWLALFLWGLIVGVINPFVEEASFRFGLLQSVARLTKSRATGVVVSSTMFGLLHANTWRLWELGWAVALNAFWLTMSSLLLGYLVMRRGGKITVPLTAHITRNSLEFILVVTIAPVQ